MKIKTEKTPPKISLKLLDAVIIAGIVAMAMLIPYLSAKGGFTVSFDSMGGTAVESQKLRYGEAIEAPPAPTRENYSFCGWYYDKEGISAVDFSNATAEKSTTFFALWKENG